MSMYCNVNTIILLNCDELHWIENVLVIIYVYCNLQCINVLMLKEIELIVTITITDIAQYQSVQSLSPLAGQV